MTPATVALRTIALADEDDFDGWRDAARALVGEALPPEAVTWQVGQAPSDLFAAAEPAAPASHASGFSVSRLFVDLARNAILHSDPQRFASSAS